MKTMLFVLALASCVAAPPVSAPARHGTARGGSEAEARELAELLDRTFELVRDTLPGLREREVEVWLLDDVRGRRTEARSMAWSGLVHLQRRTKLSRPSVLAHELVHVLADEAWERLPSAALEGLADRVACAVDAEGAPKLRASRAFHAAQALGDFELWAWIEPTLVENPVLLRFPVPPHEGWPQRLSEDWLSRPDDEEIAAYGLGFVLIDAIVRRHGWSELRRLCTTGQGAIRSAPLLELAGLDEDPATWRAAAFGMLSETELSVLAGDALPALARPIAREVYARRPDLDRATFVRDVEVRIGHPAAGLVSARNLPDAELLLGRAWTEVAGGPGELEEAVLESSGSGR